MSMMDGMMDFMMGRMSEEEKENMMDRLMEKFFADMTAEEKQKMMEKMMAKMMEGVNMMDVMPKMMMGMMGGEGRMSSMMKNMMGSDKGGKGERPFMPVMETQEDFKPWEFCPCRKLCEKAFKK